MNRKSEKNLIVGLDIGTSKIVAIVGEHEPGQPVEIMGIRFAPIRMASNAAWWWISNRPCSRSSVPSRKPS
jgi:cell division ATPase FtsA